jgi:hypothetical protein
VPPIHDKTILPQPSLGHLEVRDAENSDSLLPWLHIDPHAGRWLGTIRALIEPRLASHITLHIANTEFFSAESAEIYQGRWSVVSVAVDRGNLLSTWQTLAIARTRLKGSIRLSLGGDDSQWLHRSLLEAGSQLHAVDQLAFCRLIPTLLRMAKTTSPLTLIEPPWLSNTRLP